MNKRMKMKLLDYTLISLLAGTAPGGYRAVRCPPGHR
jgi:hypothetical protein